MSPPRKALVAGLAGLVLIGPPLVAAQELVWPRSPAQPVVRWESAVRSLAGFEVAVHGPTTEPTRPTQKLKRPSGLAFDQRGRLLISDSRQGLLLQMDPDLGVVLVLGSGTEPRLREPMGVAVHSNGNIYVADTGLQQVVGFDTQGGIVATYGAGVLEDPVDVAISPDGERLFVADAQGDRIAVFDLAGGGELESFGQRGKGAGEFYLPTALDFDGAGNLLVVDQLNSRVQIFDANGLFTRALNSDRATGFSRPRDLAIDGAGRIFLTDSAQSRIQVYDRELEPLMVLGRNGMGNGEFLGVGAIAVSGDRLAVLDRAGGRLQVFHLFGVEPRAAATREVQPATARLTSPSETQARTPPTAPAPREMPMPGLPKPRPAEQEPPVVESPAQPEAIAEVPAAEVMVAEEAIVEETLEEEATAAAAVEQTVVEEPMPEETPEDLGEAGIAQELLERVQGWARAWESQDPDSYLQFYAPSFVPGDGLTRAAWAEQRRDRLTAPSSIEVEVEILETKIGDDGAVVTFVQSYSSDRFSDRVRKSLHFVHQDGGWKIDRETVLATL